MRREIKYDYIRVLLTALVIIGHADFYTSIAYGGGIDIASQMAQNNVSDSAFHVFFLRITKFIYSFHMEAFFALSGIFLRRQIENGKYKNIKELAINRFNRLIIPMLISYFIVFVPSMFLSGYYEDNKFGLIAPVIQLFCPQRIYIWYVEALFIDSILLWYLLKVKCLKIRWIIVALSYLVGTVIISRLTSNTLFLGNPLKYFAWVWLGKYIECVNAKINSVKKHTLIYMCFVFLYCLGYFFIQYIPHARFLFSDTLTFILIVLLFALCDVLASRTENSERIEFISKYSYGLYLYAGTFNIPILIFFVNLFGIKSLGNNVMSLILCMTRIILSSLTAIVITNLILKSNKKLV